MAFGQSPDEEIPDYHPFLMQAAGMAGSVPPVTPQAQQAAPVAVAVPGAAPQAAPQMAVAPQAQPQQATPAAQPQAAADPSQTPAVVLPSAPQAPQFDYSKYEAGMNKLAKDEQPLDRKSKDLAPKWWERLAGAGVAFGTGYSGGAEAGIRAGSAIVNRRYDNAETDRQATVSADKDALSQQRDRYDLDTKGYENGLKGFGAGMEKARLQQTQASEDRNYNAGRADAGTRKVESDREYERQIGNDARSQGNIEEERKRQAARDAETGRHNKAEEGLTASEIAERRARDLKDDDATSTAAKGDQLKRQVQMNTLNSQRQNDLDKLEKGDPKDPNDAGGFQARLAAVDRNKSLKPEEKTAQKAQLTAEHAEAKNRVEDVYAQGMGTLGQSVQPVRYGPDARPLNQSNGAAARQQQSQQQPQAAAPVPVTPPKSQSQPAAAPVQQGQQQPQTHQLKDAKGNTITAEIRNGKWVNSKTGQPL